MFGHPVTDGYRFHPPINLRKTAPGCYKITDGRGVDICFVYGDQHPNADRSKLPAGEAEDIAKAIARLIRRRRRRSSSVEHASYY